MQDLSVWRQTCMESLLYGQQWKWQFSSAVRLQKVAVRKRLPLFLTFTYFCFLLAAYTRVQLMTTDYHTRYCKDRVNIITSVASTQASHSLVIFAIIHPSAASPC